MDTGPPLQAGGAFAAGPVDVRADRILRIQGYADPARVRPRILEAAERAAQMAGEVAVGEVGFRRLPVTRLDGDLLELDGTYRLRCEAFGRYLDGCRQVVAFAMTAGSAFDERIDQLMRADQPVDALFLDSAGWLAVESVTRQFCEWLKPRAAAEGLRLTRRMGPGYSYRVGERMTPWQLTDQSTLFAALAGVALPVQLLESCAMLPKMSRSGLFGLRPGAVADAAAGVR